MDWIEDFVRLTTRSEPPEKFRWWTAVSTIASVLERKTWHEWEGRISPNFYVILVGNPATRKTTAMEFGSWYLEQLQLDLLPTHSTFAHMVKLMERSGKPDQTGVKHWSVTAHAREILSFLQDGNRDIVIFLTDVFDNKPYNKGTQTQGSSFIKRPWLNLLAGAQPATLRELPDLVIKQGLASRMIFVMHLGQTRRIAEPFCIDLPGTMLDEELELRDDLLERLEAIAAWNGMIPHDTSWRETYVNWYEALDMNATTDHMQRWLGRISLHVRKLSIILCFSRGGRVLTGNDFRRAIAIVDQLKADSYMALNGVSMITTRAALNVGVLAQLRLSGGSMSFGDLYSYFVNDTSDREFAEVLQSLHMSDSVVIEGLEGKTWSKTKTIVRLKE